MRASTSIEECGKSKHQRHEVMRCHARGSTSMMMPRGTRHIALIGTPWVIRMLRAHSLEGLVCSRAKLLAPVSSHSLHIFMFNELAPIPLRRQLQVGVHVQTSHVF